MNEEDARKEADRLNIEQPNWFCPVINGSCMPSCYCYVASSAYKTSVYSGEGWTVMTPHCTNASMIGSDA